MKKSLVFLLVALASVALFVGCKNEPEDSGYKVGDKGPAGGIIVYVAKEVQTSSYTDSEGEKHELKWKYLEAAPTDVLNTTTSETGKYSWGAADSTDYKTETAIGSGWSNTKKLELAGISNFPAAKACVDFTVTVDGKTYDDWFLPSKDELNEMYNNMGKLPVKVYWSSSEYTDKSNICVHIFNEEVEESKRQSYLSRNSYSYVRPLRAFE